jgi:hypothetical protein
LKKIETISPSQIAWLDECRLKLLFYKQYDGHDFTDHPSTVLGSVSHKMYELSPKDEQSFENHWEAEIEKAKEKYFNEPLNKIYEPIEYWIPYYSIKKAQAKKIILAQKDKSKTEKMEDVKTAREENLMVGFLKGQPDLYFVKDGLCTIIDYKTGPIYKKDGKQYRIKDQYLQQLKAYGYLVMINEHLEGGKIDLVLKESNGRYSEPVQFTTHEYECFYEYLEKEIEGINSAVDKSDHNSLGNPSENSCQFCLYKPNCGRFLDFVSINEVPYALYIKNTEEIVSTNNGIRIADFLLAGIPPNEEARVRSNECGKLLICNLSKSKNNNTYYWKKQSQIFTLD